MIIKEHGKLLFDIYRSVDYGQTFSLVNPIAFQGFGKVEKILPSPIDSNTLYVSHNQFLFTGGYVSHTADDCHTFELIFQSDDGIADMILLPDGTLEIGTKHSVWRSVTGDQAHLWRQRELTQQDMIHTLPTVHHNLTFSIVRLIIMAVITTIKVSTPVRHGPTSLP
ncbi:MAG: hypothetical protein IPP15_00270 [Saprospiraceae bacterium]|uniref:Uncharacterized protein n=1 Tax=Candidatus Opimibacter skivensis TaxID=2982028 RepID=A0A9D7SSA7_9BACT|nr:hypothetical protein [Candidatus Opimibacter skivensis]